MALSRSPIKLAKTVSAMIGLRNAMSILFLERISSTIKARYLFHTQGQDHEKAVYVSVSQVLFDKRFEKKNLLLFGVGFYPIQAKNLSSDRRK